MSIRGISKSCTGMCWTTSLSLVLTCLGSFAGAPAADPAPVKPGQVITNGIGMKLIAIPAGEFVMGGTKGDDQKLQSEQPAHRVKISKPFYLGVHEVTQKEYRAVMGEAPWKGQTWMKEGDQIAASCVNWNDAVAFCRKLSDREGKTYRLPTEAEWEYACRAGTTTRFSFGDDEAKLGEYAWFRTNSWDVGEKYAHPVGQKKPNAFGLYDIHGNVFEWCQDAYDDKAYGKRMELAVDPVVTSGIESRVLRGGSWYRDPWDCRSSFRLRNAPDYRYFLTGLRVVCELR